MIIQVPGESAKSVLRPPVLVYAGIAKAGVRVLVVVREIQVVLDQRGTRQRIVADTIAVHPRIQKGQRKQKEDEERTGAKTRQK